MDGVVGYCLVRKGTVLHAHHPPVGRCLAFFIDAHIYLGIFRTSRARHSYCSPLLEASCLPSVLVIHEQFGTCIDYIDQEWFLW